MAIGIDYVDSESIITVMGVGGGGGNAVNNMIESGLDSVNFIVANTDKQALDKNKAPIKIQIGESVRGAGANPTVGEKAAEYSLNDIKDQLAGTEMLFITAGMGGGTGTGASPVIARTARQLGILTVAIVSSPFAWEGNGREMNAKKGIEQLRDNVDALIIVPNNKLLEIINPNVSFVEAYKLVDEVLLNATKGISDIITKTGHVNVDFADVRTIMSNMGDALMGLGKASGPDKAREAAKIALNSPLLDGVTIYGSKGVLVNVSGGTDLTMTDVSEAVGLIHEAAGNEANIIHGVVIDDNLKDEIHVTVVATGFRREQSSNVKDINDVLINEPPILRPSPDKSQGRNGGNIGKTIPIPPSPLASPIDNGGGQVRDKVPHFEPKRPPRGESELRTVEQQPSHSRNVKSAPDMSLIGTANQATYRRMNETKFSDH
ncbi:MAG TPA: cell division protein FtsZ [Candidatus Kapabacteria bacterium]|nr:cell division protein FtsZ [Candidatus Kapabacteria bacterium]